MISCFGARSTGEAEGHTPRLTKCRQAGREISGTVSRSASGADAGVKLSSCPDASVLDTSSTDRQSTGPDPKTLESSSVDQDSQDDALVWCDNAECHEPWRTGEKLWLSSRAAWLRTTEEEVAALPSNFDDPGPLQLARAAERNVQAEISDEEEEAIEDCLVAVRAPFPDLKRRVRLSQAVKCAVTLWQDEDHGVSRVSTSTRLTKRLSRGFAWLTG